MRRLSQPTRLLSHPKNLIRITVLGFSGAEMISHLLEPTAPEPLNAILALTATVAVGLALWWPVSGSALTTAMLAANLIHGYTDYSAMPFVVSQIAIAIAARPRTVVAFAVVDAALLVLAAPRQDVASTLVGLASLSLLTVVGLVVRYLNARLAGGEAQVRRLHDAIADLRQEERSRLAIDLSAVVSKTGGDTDALLSKARATTDPDDLRTYLHQVESGSRRALFDIRLLVARLRDDATALSLAGTDETVLAWVEAAEDALVGHGHTVELSGFDTAPPLDEQRRLPVELALRLAADHAREHAPAGSTCAFALTTADGVLTLVASHPMPMGRAPLRPGRRGQDDQWVQLTNAASAASGRCDIAKDNMTWRLSLALPDLDPGSVPAGARRWVVPTDAVAIVRGTLTLVALFSAIPPTLSVLSALRTGSDALPSALWMALLLGAALALWSPRLSSWLLGGTVVVAVLAYPPTLSAVAPANLALAAFVATLTLHARRWMALVVGWTPLAALAALRWTLTTESVVSVIVFSLAGALCGVGVHFYLESRRRHLADLERLALDQTRVREQERRDLAGELHDLVAHQLSLITMHVMSTGASSDTASLHDLVHQLSALNRNARADMARLERLLQPPTGPHIVPDSGARLHSPAAALNDATEALTAAGFLVQATMAPDTERSSAATRTTLSRLLRETSTNVIRYGEPGSVCHIEVTTDVGAVEASIVSKVPRKRRSHRDSTGWGLTGLAERIRLTNGLFSVEAHEGEWRVRASMPRWAS